MDFWSNLDRHSSVCNFETTILEHLGSPWTCVCRPDICCVSADKTSVMSADKTSVVSADKISVVSAHKTSAHKTSVVSQDISILSTTQGRSPCFVDTIEMSGETTDVLCADTTDILSAATTDVLSADTTDVLSAETQQMSWEAALVVNSGSSNSKWAQGPSKWAQGPSKWAQGPSK